MTPPEATQNVADAPAGGLVAVRFYSPPVAPRHAQENRAALIAKVVEALARADRAWSLLDAGFGSTTTSTGRPRSGAADHTLEPLMRRDEPRASRGRPSASATAYVGTSGGLAYLAPFYGVPPVALSSEPEATRPWHLELAETVFQAPGFGSLAALHTSDLPLLDVLTSELRNGRRVAPMGSGRRTTDAARSAPLALRIDSLTKRYPLKRAGIVPVPLPARAAASQRGDQAEVLDDEDEDEELDPEPDDAPDQPGKAARGTSSRSTHISLDVPAGRSVGVVGPTAPARARCCGCSRGRSRPRAGAWSSTARLPVPVARRPVRPARVHGPRERLQARRDSSRSRRRWSSDGSTR